MVEITNREESIELHTIDRTLDEELRKEAGDILWQLSGLCKVMGWSLEDVAQENLDKLASRQARGVIDGNGDNVKRLCVRWRLKLQMLN